MSTAINDDNYFQLMIWNVWPLKSRSMAATAPAGTGGVPLPSASTGPRITNLEEAVVTLQRAGQTAGEWSFVKLKLGLYNADTDRDGAVTVDGLIEAVAHARINLPRADVEAIFKVYRPSSGIVAIAKIVESLQVLPSLYCEVPKFWTHWKNI